MHSHHYFNLQKVSRSHSPKRPMRWYPTTPPLQLTCTTKPVPPGRKSLPFIMSMTVPKSDELTHQNEVLVRYMSFWLIRCRSSRSVRFTVELYGQHPIKTIFETVDNTMYRSNGTQQTKQYSEALREQLMAAFMYNWDCIVIEA